MFGRLVLAAAALLALSVPLARAQPNGAALYASDCAQCHESTDTDIRAPKRDLMRAFMPETILRALESGPMQPLAEKLSPAERVAIATYIAGRPIGQAAPAAKPESRCTTTPSLHMDGPRWNGWGADLANTRFQPQPGLTAAQVPRLHLAWAFGFSGAVNANAQPSIVGGRVFVGGGDRHVYALDAKTGCIHWSFATGANVRAAISIAARPGGGFAAYFGDGGANAYGLDAETGALLWRVKIEDHRAAIVTGAAAVHDGGVYLPVSSFEEGIGARATYQCCSFRGSLVALDAETGALRWKTYTIPEAPQPTKKNPIGTQLYGPSGAAIWSAPTLDPARGVVYVATGNAYTRPATDTSDAVLALDMRTGRMLWHRQMTAQDAYIVGCPSGRTINCPDDHGPDHDFGQSPILTHLPGGKRVLVIAQKSGVAHAVDPDQDGQILWQTRLGKGGSLGGSQWGSATDGARMYVAISDVRFLRGPPLVLDPSQGGGLHALDLSTGLVVWSVPPVPCGERPYCSPALSAAVTAIPGVVFSGGVSGILRAYAAEDGHPLWHVDTARDYETVNAVPAHGGAMDGPGPVIAGGRLYVTSGYGQWGGKPGNVLLAFSPED